MEIVNAYELVGTYRGAAALCGTTAQDGETRARAARGRPGRPTPSPPRVAQHGGVVAVDQAARAKTDGRITAKRLLPVARAAGYSGSVRNFRRAVAEAKGELEAAAAHVSAVGAESG